MKDKLTSFLATAFKGLGGAGGFLAGKGLIDSGSIGSVDAAGSSLALALATIVGAVLAHVLGKLAAKYLPGFLGNVGKGSPAFAITTAVGFAMAGSLLSSCSLSLTSDGCVLGSYTRNHSTYRAGPCVDAFGKVNRVRFAWVNEQGQELRSTVWLDRTKPVVIEYHAGGGLWVVWTEGSGISPGVIPPDVKAARDAQAAPVEAEVTGTK
jgi:hypothetical protein